MMQNNKNDKTLLLPLLLTAACQVWFLLTLLFHGVYDSPFSDAFLWEELQLPQRTPEELMLLRVYSVGALVLTLGCYAATIYIGVCKRFRAITQRLSFTSVMAVAFFLRLFIVIKVRGAYTSIAMLFLGTEMYALVLLYFVLRIRKSMGTDAAALQD